jgi:hypothetical protein
MGRRDFWGRGYGNRLWDGKLTIFSLFRFMFPLVPFVHTNHRTYNSRPTPAPSFQTPPTPAGSLPYLDPLTARKDDGLDYT